MVGIVRYLRNEGFDPSDIQAMSKALNDVCAALNIEGDASAREVIAIRIIELAASGERNSQRLRDRLLLEANADAGLSSRKPRQKIQIGSPFLTPARPD